MPREWLARRRAAAADQLVRGEFRLPDGGGVRRALLTVEGVRQVPVRLGDHCAAGKIEAAAETAKLSQDGIGVRQ